MFDWLVELATSSWAYLITPLVVLVDGVVGVLPSEAVLHAAGVGAARGSNSVILLILLAATAAVVADLTARGIGVRWGTVVRDGLIRGDSNFVTRRFTARRFRAARQQLDERPWLLTIGRFVPGLRTAVVLAAGSLEFPLARFLRYEAPGALAWASYNVLIGYGFGRVFRDSPFWVPFLASAGVAATLALAFELVRRVRPHIAGAEGS